MKLLATLNPSKTCGPDEIPNWLLKEYAELLAFPVSKIINSSFKEQRLPKIWKFADVSPLPKVKPVEDLKKRLRESSFNMTRGGGGGGGGGDEDIETRSLKF